MNVLENVMVGILKLDGTSERKEKIANEYFNNFVYILEWWFLLGINQQLWIIKVVRFEFFITISSKITVEKLHLFEL